MKIGRKTAKEITGGICPQVVNIPDLRNVKKIIYVIVADDRESILLQFYLFWQGWKTCKRKSYEDKPWKIKSIRKYKYKFESTACRLIVIRPDGTFSASISGWRSGKEINIKFEEIMEIFERGYCMVGGK